MDHLPYPTNPTTPEIQIEFICAGLLKPNTAGSVKKKENWQANNEYWAEWKKDIEYWGENASDDRSARYLQAHVYFGFLMGLLGPAFNLADFLRDGDRHVTLRNLDVLLFRIGKRESMYWGPGVHQHYPFLRDFQMSSPVTTPLLDQIALSIEVLAHTLPYLYLRGGIQMSSVESQRLIKDRMLASGWCTYWIERWSERCSLPFLYYMGAIEPSTGKRSTRSQASACSHDTCSCNNIVQGGYRTLHASDCRGTTCDFAGASTDHISRIIKSGAIPILKISRRLAGAESGLPNSRCEGVYKNPAWKSGEYIYELAVIEYTPDIDFVAISHVWSMGLGNFDANELPYCQLEFLFHHAYSCKRAGYDQYLESEFGNNFLDRIEDISHQTMFYDQPNMWKFRYPPDISLDEPYHESVCMWIDTVCIPAANGMKNEDYAGMKQRAIDKMAIVYTSAVHVLVVDPRLCSTPFERAQPDNPAFVRLLMTMATCPWMTRCWTFQERFLARQFSFCLQDARVNPRVFLAFAQLCRKYIFAPQKLIAGIKTYTDMRDQFEHSRDRNAIQDAILFEAGSNGDNELRVDQQYAVLTSDNTESGKETRDNSEFPNHQESGNENLQRYSLMLLLEALQMVLDMNGIFDQCYHYWLDNIEDDDAWDMAYWWIKPRLQRLLFSSPLWVQKIFGAPTENIRGGMGSVMFMKIWNELSRRTTSQSQDIAGILAICIGISPWQVMMLDQHPEEGPDSKSSQLLRFEGMKRILRSHRELPFSLLATYSPANHQKCETEGWVPAFPIGRISIDDDVMIWNSDRTELILPSKTYLDMYLIDFNSLEDITFFDITFEEGDPNNTDPDALFQTMVYLDKPIHASGEEKRFGLMFSTIFDFTTYQYRGIIFEVVGERSAVVDLHFHSQCGFAQPDPDQPATQIIRMRKGGVSQYILKCKGAWPQPVYKREDAKMMGYSFPVHLVESTIYLFWPRRCYSTLPNINGLISEVPWIIQGLSRAPPWLHFAWRAISYVGRMPPVSWFVRFFEWAIKLQRRIVLAGLPFPKRDDWHYCFPLTYGIVMLRKFAFSRVEKNEIMESDREATRQDLLTSSPYDAADAEGAISVGKTRRLSLRTYPSAWSIIRPLSFSIGLIAIGEWNIGPARAILGRYPHICALLASVGRTTAWEIAFRIGFELFWYRVLPGVRRGLGLVFTR